MTRRRPFLKSAGLFLLAFVPLLWLGLWGPLERPYARAYQGVRRALLFQDWQTASVPLRSLDPADPGPTADDDPRQPDGGPAARIVRRPWNDATRSYLPAALLVALVLATPVERRRRLRALGWGMLWLHVYLTLRLVLVIVAHHLNRGVLESGSGSLAARCATFLAQMSWISQIGTFAVPVLLWLLVTVERQDLQRWMARSPASG